MVREGETVCPVCTGDLKTYDRVRRSVRTKRGAHYILSIRRLKCTCCNSFHRELPPSVYPHKHYEAEIIDGVLEGLITSDTLGYEDNPCELTMRRWLNSRKKQRVL